jgi:nucleoside-diphosphate-sugar epimerase
MILLFGGTGFLGASIAKCLSESYMEYIAVTRENSNLWRIKDVQGIHIIQSKIEEQCELITKFKPEIVVCANWIGVEKKLRNNLNIQLQNKNHILKLGIASVEAKVKKFIVLGSQDEISQSLDLILDDAKPSPASEYGSVKNSLKIELEKYFYNTESVLIWSRIFSIYGEFDLSDSLIPQMIRSAKSNKLFHLNEPFRRWSYLYQSDFASAVKEIILKINQNKTINIGNPKSIQILDIADLVVERLQEYNLDLKLVSNNRISHSLARIPDSATLTELGWAPKITLDYGIKRTINGIIKLV